MAFKYLKRSKGKDIDFGIFNFFLRHSNGSLGPSSDVTIEWKQSCKVRKTIKRVWDSGCCLKMKRGGIIISISFCLIIAWHSFLMLLSTKYCIYITGFWGSRLICSKILFALKSYLLQDLWDNMRTSHLPWRTYINYALPNFLILI